MTEQVDKVSDAGAPENLIAEAVFNLNRAISHAANLHGLRVDATIVENQSMGDAYPRPLVVIELWKRVK